jgi:mRNA degradation ribonuclease J1/J2
MKLNGGQDLLSFLRENRDLKVDRLIMEGTNIGSSRLPISPSEAIDIIRRIASSSRLLIATLHGLDLEYAYALTKLASELNLECYIASTQTTKLLERIEQPCHHYLNIGRWFAYERRGGGIASHGLSCRGLIL